MVDSPLTRKLRDAARTLNQKSANQSLASRVHSTTTRLLTDWKALQPGTGGASVFAMETLSSGAPERNRGFDVVRDVDCTRVLDDFQKLGMSSRHAVEAAEQCLNLFDASYDPLTILRSDGDDNGNYASLSRIVGRSNASMLSRSSDSIGVEAFGDDVNRLNTDDRLTMDLIIMRPWENIMDKGLARISQSSPIVTIRVPSPEAWDWAATQAAGSTSLSRNFNNTYKLRDLYRNPTPVNAATKPIVPLAANDVNGVLFGGTTTYFKTGRDVSLLDLARNTNVPGYDHVDRTDLIADGGQVNAVIVAVTDPNGGNPVTENFLMSVRTNDLSLFVLSPSNKRSGQRICNLEAFLPITSASTQYNGNASTIAAKLTDGKIQARIHFNSRLDIQTGDMGGSGAVSMSLVGVAGGTPSAATTTYFGTLTAVISAYGVDVRYDEENQRKANLAIWVNYYEQQFVVPRARIYFSEYALSQEMDDNAVAATSSVVALGNGRRGLDVIVGSLNDIATGLTAAAANPELASVNSMDDQSFASALVMPMVVTTTMDFNTEELNDMNESTRLSEIHGRFRARILSMLTMLMAKSLMLNQYKGGETPVIKCWVHSSIADIVIGILEYHPDLKDRATTATGADFSMTLPNGYRLDIIKTNLDCMQQRLYAVPVIESDMGSVLSAASIRDCGTVTTNYTPTNAGSVTRRVATTCREIVFMSNKVGLMMQIQGLEAQLGLFGFANVPLSPDYSVSMAV